MRFLSFLVWIFLFVGPIANIEYAKAIESNKGRYKNKDSCSLSCNKSAHAIVVHTARDDRTLINMPFQDGFMAVVYYYCNATIIRGRPTRYMYHTFQKLCDDNYEECTIFSESFHMSSVPHKTGTTPKFSVNLVVPSDLAQTKIRTEKCKEGQITFTFKVDNKPIDYSYTNNTFFVNNWKKMPMVFRLEIKEFENVLALINFRINRRQIKSCTSFIQKECPNFCQNGLLRDANMECLILVDNSLVKATSSPGVCFTRGWNKNATEEVVYEGACAYFGMRNIRLCQHDCIDLVNCSYMCVMRDKHKNYMNSGYKVHRSHRYSKNYYLKNFKTLGYYFHKNYTGKFGSRLWTWNNVPEEKVLVNECLELPGLCKSPESCEDQDRGYRCKLNDYNNMTCLRLKNYKFIQCLHDMENFVRNKERMPNTFEEMDIFYEKLRNSELPDKYKIEKIIYYFVHMSRTYINSTSVGGSGRRNISRTVIRKIQQICRYYIVRLINEKCTIYEKKNDGIFTYARCIKKNEKEVNIPLSGKNETRDKEFVRLKINRPNNSSSASSVLTLMYYRNTDLVGESENLDKKSHLYSVNQKATIRYKNSDMIYVSFNETRNISIKFKLTQLRKVEPPSWLYAVKDECGYLAENDWRWSVDGCRKVKQAGEDYCECDHLSNFAMLFSLTMINEKHLTAFKYLSIMGSIINVLSLLMFLVFVLFINPRDKMKIDQLNIATSLLVGTLVFVFGGLLVKHDIVCKIAALLAQYLFLSAFVWMLILGVNVVRMIVSLNYQIDDWMVKYRLVIWAIGYGVSLFIVVISGSFNWADYGRVSDNVCWIDNRKYTLLSFIIPVGIIIALNVIGLFYIANTLIRNYINTKKIKVNESNELLVFLQLMVSMGLTWLPSYFATYYLTAMYLLVIFFPLQGLMMFLCVVVINKDNREKVSSYVLLRYSSLISKSTTGSETKSNPKWYSNSNSKNTEQNQVLLSDTGKEKEAFRDTEESDLPLASIRDRKTNASVHNTEC